MTKLILIKATIFLSISTLFGQSIEIGQEANVVKQFIQWSTQQKTGYDSYGKSMGNNVIWDAKYNNGQITDVIQCYSDQFIIDFRAVANFCRHYIMEYGQLAYVLTQYEDVSTEKLTEFYENNYGDYKNGDFYFSDDYKHYSKIYLANNGHATIEWRKTEPNKLPADLQAKIANKLKAQQEAEAKKIREEDEQKKKENEIKSKTYDLKEFDNAKYQTFVNSLSYSLTKQLKSNSSFPDFIQIEKQNEKYFRFNNTYSAYFKLVDYSKESTNYGNLNVVGSKDVRSENKFTLVSGDDNSCQFLKYSSHTLPTITYKGYTVMTEANVENITVDYSKGITNVKIKNGSVIYKKHLPPTDIQSLLSEKLKSETNGLYQVKYEVGQVMGDSFVITQKTKIKSTAMKILKPTAIVLVVVGALLFL